VANEPYAPIHRAAVNGDVEAIRAELARGVDVDLLTREYASAYPATPLSLAALSGQGDAIRCLVDAGADVDARGLLGKTPLHLAAMWGSFDAVEALIEAGADVNATDDLGWPPLVDAISRGSDPWGYCEFDPRIMRALIDAGADVELQPAFPGLLFHACYFGTTEALQILLESGTALEPEAIDLGRLLPDSTVIRRDPVAVARILIERGVPVNDHAMRRAVSMNNMELLELLLEHGGDVTSRNEDGETLLFVLRPADENRRLFALLLDHGVDINALNHRGTSVLMHWLDQPRGSDADLAVLREWVAILLECGADPAISYRPIFGTYDEEIADMLRRAMEDSGEDGDDQ
jgi:ankyrin repeat protein